MGASVRGATGPAHLIGFAKAGPGARRFLYLGASGRKTITGIGSAKGHAPTGRCPPDRPGDQTAEETSSSRRRESRAGAKGVGCAMSDCLGTDSAGTGPTVPPATGPVRWDGRSPWVRIRSSPWPGEIGVAGRRPRAAPPEGGRTHRTGASTEAGTTPQERACMRSCRPGPGPSAAPGGGPARPDRPRAKHQRPRAMKEA